jgi:CARDB
MQAIHSINILKTNIFFAFLAFFMLISTFVSAKNGPVGSDLIFLNAFDFQVSNQIVSFKVNIKNIGDGDCDISSLTFKLFISKDASIGNDVTLGKCTVTTGQILNRNTKEFGISFDFANNAGVWNQTYGVIQIDPDNLIKYESNKSNNWGIFSIPNPNQTTSTPPNLNQTIPIPINPYSDIRGIDLVLQNFRVQVEGINNKLLFEIKNIGTTTCPDAIVFQLYTSTDGIKLDGKMGSGYGVVTPQGGLVPKAILAVNFIDILETAAPKGQWPYFIIVIDSQNLFTETNENNNTISFKR